VTIMNQRLAKRLERIEKSMALAGKDAGILVRFAHVHMLPPAYEGERHEVPVRGYPSADPVNDCVIQEFPGPGPELEFDFRKDTQQRTMLIRFVGSDGDGSPEGYLPEHAGLAGEAQTTAQAWTGCAR
jgi:hypothetical protein